MEMIIIGILIGIILGGLCMWLIMHSRIKQSHEKQPDDTNNILNELLKTKDQDIKMATTKLNEVEQDNIECEEDIQYAFVDWFADQNMLEENEFHEHIIFEKVKK